jgi:hypothetical protein
MVLHLKMRESKSLRGLPSALCVIDLNQLLFTFAASAASLFCTIVQVDAGWSSPVARQAHNLKVTGSNPVPATSSLTSLDLSQMLIAFVPPVAPRATHHNRHVTGSILTCSRKCCSSANQISFS